MENLVDYYSGFVRNISPHRTLGGIIKNKLNDQKSTKRKNYFGVVDICNPLHTYFKLKYPESFKDSIETKKKFSLGNKQHKILEKKIEKIEGFIDKEIILDGELLGIALKGRADAKVSNSIWEIKSKETLPLNQEELLEKYPQDIEQICFYSLLDPENPLENYLIFTTHFNTNECKAFKIKIKDLGKAKNLAISRINKINEWIDERAPKESSKCRYCYDDCEFRKEDLCSYYQEDMLPCGLKDSIEIHEAPEIVSLINEISLSKTEENIINYSLFNIITPRKLIHKENRELDGEDFDGSEKYSNKQLIQDILFKLNYGISFEDYKSLENSKRIKEIYQNKNSFIKILSNGKETVFPILIHISESESSSSLNKVSDYKRGELGIHCFNNKSNKGYLISFFPKLGNELRVFEITYEFNKDAIIPLRKVVNLINERTKEILADLPKCPNFIHKTCPYKEVCQKD